MNYAAPVQAIMGMAGFNLDGFVSYPICWSLVRISKFGYTKTQAIKTQLNFQTNSVFDAKPIVGIEARPCADERKVKCRREEKKVVCSRGNEGAEEILLFADKRIFLCRQGQQS